MRGNGIGRIKTLLVLVGGLASLGIPQRAGAQAPGIPCAGKAKAVTANWGSSTHNAASLVDSYQSSLGAYGGSNVAWHGDVQAGGPLIMNGGVVRGASLGYSPGGMSVVSAPAGATNLGAFNVNGTVTLAGGDYQASVINVNSGGRLQVSGPVRIWVSGGVNINALANPNGTPKNLELLLTGTTPANVNSGGQLFGLLYAPQAQVFVNALVFGAVVGSTVTLNSGGQVHFDQDSGCTGCASGLVQCAGVCTSTQSDANHCGSCGNACPLSSACEMGTCLPAGACLPGNAPSVALAGTTVYAYEPMGSWVEATTGIKRFRIEPAGAPPALMIPTPAPVSSCTVNTVTRVVACTGDANDVYIINPVGTQPGISVSTMLTDGATAPQTFSGGFPNTSGLAIDPVFNRAVVAVGLAPGGNGGLQTLDLGSLSFGPVVSLGPSLQTSEDILIDPLRRLVLSPNEQNHYMLENLNTLSVFDMDLHTLLPLGEMDSAAEDCSTGIALASVEFTGQLVLVNLNGASFSGGKWTAPVVAPDFPELETLFAGTCGISVDPRNHLGVVTGEFGGAGFGAISLPSAPLASTAAPALLDYIRADIPDNPACGGSWAMGMDPHSTTVYASPSSGKSFAVMVNAGRSCAAVVDLQALLAAPRVSGTHTAQTPLPAGVVRFVQ